MLRLQSCNVIALRARAVSRAKPCPRESVDLTTSANKAAEPPLLVLVDKNMMASLLAHMDAGKWRSLGICVLYAVCSTFMSMIYKAILSGYEFQASFLLLACQVSAGLGFCLIAMFFLPKIDMLHLKPFQWDTLQA